MVEGTSKEMAESYLGQVGNRHILFKKEIKALTKTEVNILGWIDYTTLKSGQYDLDLKYNGEELELLHVWINSDEIMLLGSFFDSDAKKSTLGQFTLNPEKEEVKLVQTLISFGTPKERIGGFMVRQSEDQTKIAVGALLPTVKGEDSKIAFRLYDPEMKVLNKQDAVFNAGKDGYGIRSFFVSNEGHMAAYAEWNKGVAFRDAEFPAVVIAIGTQGEPLVQKLMFPGQSVSAVKFGLKPGGKIGLFGMNAERPKGLVATGTPELLGTKLFWATIDPQSTATIDVRSARIPKEYFKEKEDKKEQTKVDRNFNSSPMDYYIGWASFKKLHYLEDGSLYAVFESSYKTQGQMGSIVYEFYDAAIFHVDDAEELVWGRKIKKEQTGDVDVFAKTCSVFSFVRGDNLHVLYNDHASNHPMQKDGKLREYGDEKSNSFLVLETITRSGEQSSEVVLSNKESKFFVTPRQMSPMPDGSIFVMGSNGGKTWMGRLNIQP
jgi:hypothetical protein